MSETMRDLLLTPVSVAGSGAILSLGLVSMNTKFMGMPAPISLGLAMGGASLFAGTIKETVLETVLPNNQSQLVYDMTAPVLSGAAAVGIVVIATGGKPMSVKAMGEMFALGVVSEMVGSYVSDNMLGPAIMM